MYIDSHCHLSELDADHLQAVLQEAKDQNIHHLVAIGAGYGFESNKRTLEIAKAHSHIHCALAIHPHNADKVTSDQLEQLFSWYHKEEKVVAVGEIGLDYHYMHSDKESQIQILEKFVEQAKSCQKPLVIHDRDCEMECVDILKKQGADEFGGVVHCFTGTRELAERYLDLGFYVSFSGIITFKNAEDLREVVKMVPMDRLLIETDSPFLAPVPFRGRKNQPAYVRFVAEKVAELKNISVEEVAKTTAENTTKLFRFS